MVRYILDCMEGMWLHPDKFALRGQLRYSHTCVFPSVFVVQSMTFNLRFCYVQYILKILHYRITAIVSLLAGIYKISVILTLG